MKNRYIVIIIMGSLFICLYLFHATYNEAKEKAVTDLVYRQQILAHHARDEIESFFNTIEQFLTHLSTMSGIIDLNDTGRQAMDVAFNIRPEGVTALTRMGADGRILYTTPLDEEVIQRDLSGQQHVKKILSTHRPVASDVFTAVQGHRAIAVHVPVFDGDRFKGGLAVLVDFHAISKRSLAGLRIGETGYAWMISQKGVELYCPVPGHTGKSVFDTCKDFPGILAMAEKMVQGQEGIASYRFDGVKSLYPDNTEKQAFFLPIRIIDTFWTVVVASSMGEVLATLVGFKNKLIIIMGMFMGISFILSYYSVKAWGIVREEAERKKAQEALRKSQERYREIVEGTENLVTEVDSNGRFLFVNEAAHKIFGIAPVGCIGKLAFDFVHPDDRQETLRHFEMWVKEKKDSITFENRQVGFNGQVRHMLWSTKFHFDDSGAISSIKSIARDITDRKNAEEALRISNDRFQRIFKSETIGIILADFSGRIMEVNDAFLQMTGYSREDLLLDRAAMNPLEWIRQNPTVFHQMKERGVIPSFEREYLRSDGSVLPVMIAGVQLKEEGERVLCFILDMTEKKKADKDLLRSEATLSSIFKAAPIGIGVVVDRIIQYANDRLCEMTGYSQDEFLGRRSRFLYHSDEEFDQVGTIKYHQISLYGTGTIETHWRKKDGSDINVLLSSTPINAGDLTAGVTFTALDITQRKQAEAALKESEEKYSTIVQESPIGIFYYTMDGVITECNKKFVEIIGSSRESLLGFNMLKQLTDDNVRAAVVQSLRTGDSCFQDWYSSVTGNKTAYLRILFKGICNKTGEIIAGLGIVEDISERKRAESINRALFQISNAVNATFNLEELYSSIHESLNSLMKLPNFYIALYDQEGGAISFPYYVDEFDDHTSYVIEFKKNPSLTGAVVLSKKPVFLKQEALAERARKGEIIGTVPRIWMGVPLIIRNNVIGVLAVQSYTDPDYFDTSDLDLLVSVSDQIAVAIQRKQVEEELRRYQEHLEELVYDRTQELEKEKIRAEAASKAKSEFLANMSHEIRTPLNAVTGFSELLSSLVTDEKQKSYLDAIKSSGKNLMLLINDILDLSKIEAGKLDIHWSPVDLRGLLKEIEQIFALQASEKGLRFIIRISDEVPPALELDEIRLRQVLLNIVGNAVKFTEKGHIKLSVETCGSRNGSDVDVYILVEDTGVGISDKEIETIFDSFKQQSDQDNSRYGGTGLGLAICRRLVEMMNGLILVESTEGKGSLFKIVIRDVAVENREIESLKASHDHGEIHFERGRVLVVDDVESNRHFLNELLAKANLDVLEAHNGHEAILICPEFQPDVILMDIRMPVMNGIDALTWLRNDQRTRAIPVLAVTASSDAQEQTDLLEKGFDGVLLKPVETGRLLSELSRFLAEAGKDSVEHRAGKNKPAGMTQPLSPETLARLPELIRILESDYRKQWEVFKIRLPVSAVKTFGNEVRDLGKAFGIGSLVEYGERLILHVDNFDVNGMQTAVDEFPHFILQLKSETERRINDV